MSPAFTKIALAGIGNLGQFMLEELVAAKAFNITVLSRQTKLDLPQGVHLATVDYNSAESVETAVRGIQVIISTLSLNEGNQAQEALATAAKKQGVKVFVPSEFGNVTNHLKSGEKIPFPIYGKKLFQDYLKNLGLPSILVFTGPFTDFIFAPFTGFDFAAGKVEIVGKGESQISMTTRRDIARFLVHVLANLPESELTSNLILRVEGDRKSFKQAVKLYEETHPGKKIEISYKSLEEAKKIGEEDKGIAGFINWLLVSWEQGMTSDKGGELNAQQYFPDWDPQSVKQVLETFD